MKNFICTGLLWLLLLPELAAANPIKVVGRVTDSRGAPLPGVTVTASGTSRGVTTDVDGRYSLTGIPANATLTFSFVGMRRQKVALNGRTTINIALEPADEQLDELVVVGYGRQKKVNLTGAVDQVNGKVLENRAITNLGQGLQGTIPNLQVSQKGFAPGQGASFNVRGFTSINGGSPLVLVDGVVQDPNLVNPNDVENVSVLKDASSAAIYGARAAYGVVLITTKSGRKNQPPTATVSMSYTSTAPIRLNSNVDTRQYIEYMNLASRNTGSANYFDQRLVDNAMRYYNDPVNNLPVYYDPAIDTDGKYRYSGNTDWLKELYKNGGLQQVNASVTGGTSRSRYYFSYGYMNQDGFIRAYNDRYLKHMVTTSISTDVRKWLTLTTKLRYSYTFEDHPSGPNILNAGLDQYSGQMKNDIRPLMPIRHPDGKWSGQGDFTNPFAVGRDGGYDRRKVNDLWVTGDAEIRATKDLRINADYTFNPYSGNRERTVRLMREYWAEPGKYNLFPWTNPSSVTLENNNDYYTAMNAYLNYTPKFGKHGLQILLGYNHEVKSAKWMFAKRENLIDNDLPAINRATGKEYTNGSETSWAVQGLFFRLGYDWSNRYLLELNGRYDGSSKFPKGQRFGFFPSVSAAWRVSEEPFWEPLKGWWNEMKLRLSYGLLGNQYLNSNFPYIASYDINTSMGYILGGERSVGVSPGGLVSPSFTWERVRQYNIGADIELLDHRLTAGFNAYRRFTEGMYAAGKPAPGVLGVGVPSENSANLKTYGWELTLGWKDNIGELAYRASFVLSDAQAVITRFNNPTGILSSYYPGQRIGDIWGFKATGLFQSEEEVAKAADQSQLYAGKWNPGDVRYVDLDGDGKISKGKNTLTEHGDLSVIGNNTPRYLLGLNLGAEWRGFDFTLFLQGVGKRDLWIGDSQLFGIGSQWEVPRRASLDFWTPENPKAKLPRPYINGGHGNREVSSLYLLDASYIRLKQLMLGYTLPEAISRRVQLKRARIYLSAENLLTLTRLSELYDPENPKINAYPIARSLSAGISVTF